MTALLQLDAAARIDLERRMQRTIQDAASLEQAAQRYTDVVYAALRESLVLLRLFVTVRFADLPASNREIVTTLVGPSSAAAIDDDTLVLSLLGTTGDDPAWCSRHDSRGHVGIPLISQAFVEKIPMIARMLEQLGVELDWIDRRDAAVVGRTFGLHAGAFHVEDAATAVDSQGRKIIVAQDFVTAHGVRSVFGIGGGYVGTPVYLTIIGFCRDQVTRAQAVAMRPHIDRFKAETDDLVRQGRLFAP